MEDYKILIYIVLSILYFLFKGKGKKKKPVTRKKTQSAEQNSQEKRRPKSFEELLSELSGENQKKEEFSGRNGGEEILRERESIKPLSDQVDERPINQEISREEYENADETLKELFKKGEKLKSIDELVDIQEVSTQSNRFKEFNEQEDENHFAREIREGLSNPESAKKAIIYAEIFNRKY